MTIPAVVAGALIDPVWGNAVADEINAIGTKGYVISTSDFTGRTTVTDVSGITVTWTADPARLYLITARCYWFVDVAGSQLVTRIRDGSSVTKAEGSVYTTISPSVHSTEVSELVTGLSGSVTRKLTAGRGSGSATVVSILGSSSPIMLLVQDVGAA